MDLNYGAEYEDFRKEVQAFCKEYQGVSFKSDSNVVADTLNDSSATKKSVSYTHLRAHETLR